MMAAFNRPEYQRQTLESWSTARGFFETPVHVQLEPSPKQDEVIQLLRDLGHPDLTISVNERVLGPLHNPWVGMNTMFEGGFDFVLSADDDLPVSEDILEYFAWAKDAFQDDEAVACVSAYRREVQGGEYQVRREDEFHSWVWGTWADRWFDTISPTWDHDYSTGEFDYNKGFDWNLKQRVLPSRGMWCARPLTSRVTNIGVHGAHGTPDLFEQSESFWESRPQGTYELTNSRVDSLKHD